MQKKFLTLGPKVKYTNKAVRIVFPVIIALEPYFEKHNIRATVTSILRDAHDQLGLIKTYLRAQRLSSKYPEVMALTNPEQRAGGIYVWQMAWSELLNKGVIINPPLQAACLTDYMGPDGKGPNRKSSIIRQTPHVHETCFDIGGSGGKLKTIQDELLPVTEAFKDKVKGMVRFLPEHKNNAIHIDCE